MSSPTMDELTSCDTQPTSPLKGRVNIVYTSAHGTHSPTIDSLSQSFPLDGDQDSPAPSVMGTTDDTPSNTPQNRRPQRKAKIEAIDKSIAQCYSSRKPRRRAKSHCPLSFEQQSSQPDGNQASQSFTSSQSSTESYVKRKSKPGCKKQPKPKRSKKSKTGVENGTQSNASDTVTAEEEVITSTPKDVETKKKRVWDTTWLDEEPVQHFAESLDPPSASRRDTENSMSPSLSCSQRTYSDPSSEDDSDDEELPDMLGGSITNDTVNKGDLIWLKRGSYPFWPAVVRIVYRVKKRVTKMTVAFIGDIGDSSTHQQFRVNYRKQNVFPFASCGHDQHLALKQEGLDSPYKEHFRNALEEAETYLFRKAKDDSIDIFQYFSHLFKSSHVDTSMAALDSLQETSALDKTAQAVLPGTPDSSPNTSKESEENNSSPDFTLATLQQIQSRTISNEKLVEFVKQEKCKNHLSAIFHSRVPCKKHTLFFKSMKTKAEKNELRFSGFGPIADEKQREEIIEAVLRYANEWTKKEDEQLNVLDYCLTVLVPEAIIYAIHKVLRLTPTLAVEHFSKGAQYFREEELQMERQFDRQISHATSSQSSESENE